MIICMLPDRQILISTKGHTRQAGEFFNSRFLLVIFFTFLFELLVELALEICYNIGKSRCT